MVFLGYACNIVPKSGNIPSYIQRNLANFSPSDSSTLDPVYLFN